MKHMILKVICPILQLNYVTVVAFKDLKDTD